MFLPMSERNLTSGPATGTPSRLCFFPVACSFVGDAPRYRGAYVFTSIIYRPTQTRTYDSRQLRWKFSAEAEKFRIFCVIPPSHFLAAWSGAVNYTGTHINVENASVEYQFHTNVENTNVENEN